MSSKRAVIENVVAGWMGGRTPARPQSPPNAPAGPPLESFKQLQPEPPKKSAPPKTEEPVVFGCEDDVRAAILANTRILIGRKTIVTPSARDLADANNIFLAAD